MRLFSILAASGLLAVLGCGGPTGPTKYPVRGSVRVNGRPVELIAVQFLHTDPTVTGNARIPTAVTDAQGHFQLSTAGTADGAVPGQYIVTFQWLSARDDAIDLLGGRLADPTASPWKVTIEPRTNELPPFELSIDETSLRRLPTSAQP